MYIKKLEIEGGFLDGLNVNVHSGLNVIIGGRGTGKSSIVELVRYCLAAPTFSGDGKRSNSDHAKNVLGDGRITVTLDNNGEEVLVTRSGSEAQPKSNGFYFPPIVFSQTEIENIGLSSTGRINLIDRYFDFLGFEDKTFYSEEIKVTTDQIARLEQEIDELNQRASKIPELNEILKVHQKNLDGLNQNVAGLASERELGEDYSKKTSEIALKINYLTLLRDKFNLWIIAQNKLLREFPQVEVEIAQDSNLTSPYAVEIEAMKGLASESLRRAIALKEKAGLDIEKLNGEKIVLDEKVRGFRQKVNELQKGSGEILRQMTAVQQTLKELEVIPKLVSMRQAHMMVLKTERDSYLDKKEKNKKSKEDMRLNVINKLNDALNPTIRIRLEADAIRDQYIFELTESLKGGGLKYKELVELISKKISPREFVEIVENFETEKLEKVLKVGQDRALKIISTVRDRGWAGILASELEDDVKFSLLDGAGYKDLSEISTGQRCAVILPIILEITGEIIILDQPEDHLDNAYVADTLVPTMKRSASGSGQLIVATHNANIPVLGEASQVIYLKSDGSKAFVEHVGNLNDRATVEAITKVMEGGYEAFAKRDAHYKRFFN